jgi:hypothetical protein
MRMRKLGEGQSVVFYVPEEIKNKILEREVKADHVGIDVSDVISWAISETCIDIRRSMPLWAVQGQRFEDQSKLWTEARTDNGFIMSKAQAERFLEDEARGLEARYRPSSNTDVTSIMRLGETKEKDAIIERCWEFDDLKFNSATLQEEQERELSPEIQQERQVQKIGYAKPADHGLHSDVLKFVSSGVILSDSKGYKPAFEALRETSAAKHLEVSQFPRSLLVTEDFARTIQKSGTSSLLDSYQRSVQWVLTSVGATTNTTTVKHMMVISPYEAQELLPEIKKSKIVALHLYSPRPNLSFRALDDLDLYTTPAQANRRVIPRVLVVLLNLFAGQLYLGSYKEYVEVCQLLGLAWKVTEEGCIVAADGFIVQRGDGSPESTFENSPVKFLRVLLTKIRRNCEGIEKTHMGKVLDGRLLLPSDFGEDDDTSDGLVGGLSQLQLSNDV